MTRPFHRLLATILVAVACVAAATALLRQPHRYVLAEDRNGDGRLDAWHTYDRLGALSELSVDTNFDGRSDVHEYYEHGALVRRESDRDFNDRVDLVQEFDPTTREDTRSVVDTDFDGAADLLVLFQHGRPVFWKSATPAGPDNADVHPVGSVEVGPRAANDDLIPFADPFARDLAVRAVLVAAGSDDCVGVSASAGLPASGVGAASPLVLLTDAGHVGALPLPSVTVVPYSPRGPPASPLLS